MKCMRLLRGWSCNIKNNTAANRFCLLFFLCHAHVDVRVERRAAFSSRSKWVSSTVTSGCIDERARASADGRLLRSRRSYSSKFNKPPPQLHCAASTRANPARESQRRLSSSGGESPWMRRDISRTSRVDIGAVPLPRRGAEFCQVRKS